MVKLKKHIILENTNGITLYHGTPYEHSFNDRGELFEGSFFSTKFNEARIYGDYVYQVVLKSDLELLDTSKIKDCELIIKRFGELEDPYFDEDDSERYITDPNKICNVSDNWEPIERTSGVMSWINQNYDGIWIYEGGVRNLFLFTPINSKLVSIELVRNPKQKAKLNLKTNYSNVELVPVSELVKFREFNRRVEPKWDKEDSDENINNIKKEFLTNGIKSPLIIDYYQNSRSVLLAEGNHRLSAALELGMKYLPCRVIRVTGNIPDRVKNKVMKVPGIQPDKSNYVKADLLPSEIGIKGTKELSNELY